MSKLITKEILSKAEELIKSGEYDIQSYEPMTVPSVYVGSIRVCGSGTGTYMYMDEGLNSDYVKLWKNDVGNILLKCFKKNMFDRLYVISNNDYKFLIYRIQDDEYRSFSDNGFVHLQIGDMHYTIIRFATADFSFAWKDIYVREELPEKDMSKEKDEEDDYRYEEEPEPTSYSLFDE